MIWIIAIIFSLLVATLVVDVIISAPRYRGPVSGHFDRKKFINPDGVRARGLLDVIKWALSGDPGEWENLVDEYFEYGTPPEAVVDSGNTTITFVNHSTFLIQTNRLNILTDPLWCRRASPFQWVGPERMHPPGLRFEDLPDIHIVLISHNHYDHLDIATVRKLNDRHSPLFVTPLGVSRYLKKNGITNTVELDWWEEHRVNEDVVVAGVPAQHFSGRGITDRDKTLWCGYVLQTPSGNIYFAGDTGYDGFFGKIGQRYAPVDVALIPIGAYRPRWFMSPIHVDPEEAVLIHKDVQAKTSIGMHFGTFSLADDGMLEPVEDLAKARAKHGLSESEFLTLKEGTSRTFVMSGAVKKVGS